MASLLKRTGKTVPEKTTKPRKGGGRGAKQKGTRGEVEICEIGIAENVPCQRVVASGAMKGAEGDIKIGVELNEDGTMPERDESVAAFRGEVKNRKTSPEAPYEWLSKNQVHIVIADKPVNEAPYRDLAQSPATKVLAWKRAKTPVGALKEGRWNDCWLMLMGAKDFFGLLRELMQLRKEVKELRATVRILRKDSR